MWIPTILQCNAIHFYLTSAEFELLETSSRIRSRRRSYRAPMPHTGHANVHEATCTHQHGLEVLVAIRRFGGEC